MIVFGEKNSFAVIIEITKIDKLKKAAWGGFELWVNSRRFGDLSYDDLITGNNYWMIEKIFNQHFPALPSEIELVTESEILKTIHQGYYGESVLPVDLKKSFYESVFWGKYIILPNNNMPFDHYEMIFFEKSDQEVKFIYADLNEGINETGYCVMDKSIVINVCKEFLDYYAQLFV